MLARYPLGRQDMDDADIDIDRIDEAVLALMFLTLHEEDRRSGMALSLIHI